MLATSRSLVPHLLLSAARQQLLVIQFTQGIDIGADMLFISTSRAAHNHAAAERS